MLLRERETERGLLVSVCDDELIGETFENGELSLTVNESFYGGEEAESVGEEALIKGLERASIANLVGEECVEIAVEAEFIDEHAVIDVGGTQHAQLLRLR